VQAWPSLPSATGGGWATKWRKQGQGDPGPGGQYQVVDNIILEVKQSFINMEQSRRISRGPEIHRTAEENLRLEEERYKYQVSTQTDVLNAVTFLAQAGSTIRRPDVYNIASLAGTGHGKDVSLMKIESGKL